MPATRLLTASLSTTAYHEASFKRRSRAMLDAIFLMVLAVLYAASHAIVLGLAKLGAKR
jgi:hypothetical protein